MKRIFALLTGMTLVCALAACGGTQALSGPEQLQTSQGTSDPESAGPSSLVPVSNVPAMSEDAAADEGHRVLVAYFSATGNTENIALHLRDILDADLYCKTVRRVQVRRRTDGAAVRLFLRRRAKMCGITAGKTAIAMAIRNISGWMR